MTEVLIPLDSIRLSGELEIPEGAHGIVVFAHGSGSSRYSPRNRFVASEMRRRGFGTLLFDLLTEDEEAVDLYTRHLRFDIGLLAERLVAAVRWLMELDDVRGHRFGFFGASTGGAAALVAAAKLNGKISAVVSRGGRPDLAAEFLPAVTAPVLLIAGGADDLVIRLNEQAFARLECRKELRIVPGATHLFEEEGALKKVADLAADWFETNLADDDRDVIVDRRTQARRPAAIAVH